jgi:2-oxoglutarate ferredoxin oxidoreductase subunit alpha
MKLAREKGLKVGLLRPITLYPFPTDALAKLAERTKVFLTVEMNAGQMVEDVRLAINGKCPVHFYGRMGGMIPSPEEVLTKVESLAKEFQLAHV